MNPESLGAWIFGVAIGSMLGLLKEFHLTDW